jgi:hypothetical protein
MPAKKKANKKKVARKTVAEIRAEARARAAPVKGKPKPKPKPKPKRKADGTFLPGNQEARANRKEYEFYEDGSEAFKKALTGLSRIYMSQVNAALVLGLSPDAFKKRLTRDTDLREIWDTGRAHAEVDLRMKQSELAKTAPGMAIFLGKNYLGQRDEQYITKKEESILKLDIGKLSTDKLRTLQGIMKELNPAPEAVDAEFEAVA